MSAEPLEICTRSAALLVTFAALSAPSARAGVPGCKSTRSELLPGRIVRWVSPATTSTSSGGSTVLVVVAAKGADSDAVALSAAGFTVAVVRCLDFAGEEVAFAEAGAGAGRVVAGVPAAGWSYSASSVSGNQKSR